jgi:hypothetical protein
MRVLKTYMISSYGNGYIPLYELENGKWILTSLYTVFQYEDGSGGIDTFAGSREITKKEAWQLIEDTNNE